MTPRSMTLNASNCYKFEISRDFAIWKAPTTKRMKIDPIIGDKIVGQ